MFFWVAAGMIVGAAASYALILWVLWMEYRESHSRCPCPFCPVEHE
jgi:hypothetical protein